MIPQNTSTLIAERGIGESGEAFMASDRVIYDLLTSTMYSRPLRTAMQEYIQNALDEHTLLNVSAPIEISVPDETSPQWSVKDYGRGMDFDTAKKVFVGYGLSDKQATNALVGGFGMGAKSGLGYADSYSIASNKDGRQIVCFVSKNAEGIPRISLQSERPTTEPNGTTVIIPIKACDYPSTILQELDHILQFMPKEKYTLKTQAGREWKIDENPIRVDLEHAFFPKRMPYQRNAARILVNQTIYPIDDIDFLDHGTKTLVQGVVLRAQTGDIDINPNREQVRMTPRTKQFIQNKARLLNEKVKEFIKNEVEKSKPYDLQMLCAALPSSLAQQINSIRVQNPNLKLSTAGYECQSFQLKRGRTYGSRTLEKASDIWGSPNEFYVSSEPKSITWIKNHAKKHGDTNGGTYIIAGEPDHCEKWLKDMGIPNHLIIRVKDIDPNWTPKRGGGSGGGQSGIKFWTTETDYTTQQFTITGYNTIWLTPKEWQELSVDQKRDLIRVAKRVVTVPKRQLEEVNPQWISYGQYVSGCIRTQEIEEEERTEKFRKQYDEVVRQQAHRKLDRKTAIVAAFQKADLYEKIPMYLLDLMPKEERIYLKPWQEKWIAENKPNHEEGVQKHQEKLSKSIDRWLKKQRPTIQKINELLKTWSRNQHLGSYAQIIKAYYEEK